MSRNFHRVALAEALDLGSVDKLAEAHGEWIEAGLRAGKRVRQSKWNECVAVGGREFVARVEADLGARARYRNIEPFDDSFGLREPRTVYEPHFGVRKSTSKIEK
ncbi:MAG: hypothetical protein HY270_10080 [Deltaproteobacteria bacterium]|nr:hypothetical protein [Deltaproteobacteria bacterium]